ncbi:MAG TPA: histidine phosphatase family protein [Polyangia bacterium]|nr:histidine phosphatase family protein [Polyangia bacterium]
MLSLYLLRHGETAFSHHNRFCGRIDAPLTSEGRAMAAAFAEAYGRVPWDAIVTSSRTRTVDTATPLAARLGLQVRRDPRLDEMSYGDWQGLSKAEAAGRHPEHFARWLENPSIGAPNGEPPREVAARAVAALDDLRARFARGNVLVVSHKAILRILFCQLLGIDVRHYRAVDWPVAGLTRIDIQGRHLSLQTFADVSHLNGTEATKVDAALPDAPAADQPVAMTG